MSVTMNVVLEVLEPDEPNYDKAASLGPDALPHLNALVQGDDPMLAAKAAFAASLLKGDQGKDVVAAAAHSGTASVRVAAAAGANNLPADAAAAVLMDLVDDDDAGVRKVALSSIPADAPPHLSAKVASRSGGAAGAGSAAVEESTPAAVETGAVMPGEGEATMPSNQPAAGLMPGEKPHSAGDAAQGTGLMPGEQARQPGEGASGTGLMPGA